MRKKLVFTNAAIWLVACRALTLLRRSAPSEATPSVITKAARRRHQVKKKSIGRTINNKLVCFEGKAVLLNSSIASVRWRCCCKRLKSWKSDSPQIPVH